MYPSVPLACEPLAVAREFADGALPSGSVCGADSRRLLLHGTASEQISQCSHGAGHTEGLVDPVSGDRLRYSAMRRALRSRDNIIPRVEYNPLISLDVVNLQHHRALSGP
jgi:hypothetical protein